MLCVSKYYAKTIHDRFKDMGDYGGLEECNLDSFETNFVKHKHYLSDLKEQGNMT